MRFLLLLWLFPLCLSAQTDEPVLRLNTEMHTAKLNRIDTDKQGQYIVTSNQDKTAKLWDTQTGALLRTFRPPIGEGNEGKLYAAAISPDGEAVAVGGWSEAYSRDKAHDIYIFEAQSGTLQHRITGLPSRIFDLEFSPNGRYLAASLKGSNGIRLYRTTTYSLLQKDTDYGDNSNNLAFSPDGRLATVSYDGYVRLYDAYGRLEKKVKPSDGDRPYSLAFSPDGQLLAVGFRDSPRLQVLHGQSLKLLYEPDVAGARTTSDRLNIVAFSADGTQLVAGGFKKIRVFEQAGRGPYQDYNACDNTVMDIKPLPDGSIAFGGTFPDWGILNPDTGERLQYQVASLNSYGSTYRSHFRLSYDGFEVGAKPSGEQALRFHLMDKKIVQEASSQPAFREAHQGLSVTDWQNKFNPKLNGKDLSFLETYERNRSVDIAEDGSRIVFGAEWHLYALDRDGKQLWEKDMPGTAWCVNIAGNKKVVAAALGDGTIRWYRLSDGAALLSLFLHPDNKRWILWTPSGYYDAAPGAEDLLGWHLNQGAGEEALFYPVSKFRYDYYRPDIVDRVLETLDEDEAVRQANALANRTRSRGKVAEELPPTVKILRPGNGTTLRQRQFTLDYSINSPNGEDITGLQVLIDGRPMPGGRGLKPKGERGSVEVRVPAQDCQVSLLAKNRFGTSEAASIQVKWAGAAAQTTQRYKPKLYVLAIGVSEYQNEEFKLRYAAKDAQDFVRTIKRQNGQLYRDVQVKLLTDADADRVGILQGLEWLVKETTQHDVAMLFFAGHGLENTRGTFYYLPVEADDTNLRYNGIMKEDIKETVKTITGKVVLFMDACHSGNLMTTTRRRGGPDMTQIINELIEAENGAVVFSSSAGRQSSLEDVRWNNGAFTKALVEGLEGEADLFGGGKITCKSLDAYITDRVKELTGGEQSPTTNFPPNVEDFPIAVPLD